ncbi:PP2C family protein-serine/threonine phosphatase [Streptomyces violaceusniger]|uniref:PP2C family protein-serine/threonine phosphatase n=1 Tax=Streptomyces violaceusniger TaxID=68280 RepID=UPI00341E68CD
MAIPVGLILLIACVDLLTPTQVHLGPLLVVAPALTPSFAGPRGTALIGALAVAAQVVIAALRGGFTVNHQVQIAAVAVISLLIVAYAQEQRRRHRELARVRSVSEATQRVVLRPLPHRLGPLRVASLYMAAEDEAQIGGDLYAATRVRDSTRMIIGDVRGKGLASISDASVLMGAFREAAHFSPGLLELADVLERSVCRHLAEHITIAYERGGAAERPAAEAELSEHFITALLVDIPDEDTVAHLTNCGHPPPLLLPERGEVTTLSTAQPAPPLGMCGLPNGSSASGTPDTFAFEDGDTLLLYTDGVIEARAPDGSFYPLAQRVGQWRCSGPEGLLHHLRRDLLDHVGGRLGDDAAMVVIQRSPALHPVQQLRKMVPVNGAHR